MRVRSELQMKGTKAKADLYLVAHIAVPVGTDCVAGCETVQHVWRHCTGLCVHGLQLTSDYRPHSQEVQTILSQSTGLIKAEHSDLQNQQSAMQYKKIELPTRAGNSADVLLDHIQKICWRGDQSVFGKLGTIAATSIGLHGEWGSYLARDGNALGIEAINPTLLQTLHGIHLTHIESHWEHWRQNLTDDEGHVNPAGSTRVGPSIWDVHYHIPRTDVELGHVFSLISRSNHLQRWQVMNFQQHRSVGTWRQADLKLCKVSVFGSKIKHCMSVALLEGCCMVLHRNSPFGDPVAVVALDNLDDDGQDCADTSVDEEHDDHDNELLVVLEDHGLWVKDLAQQLPLASAHSCKTRIPPYSRWQNFRDQCWASNCSMSHGCDCVFFPQGRSLCYPAFKVLHDMIPAIWRCRQSLPNEDLGSIHRRGSAGISGCGGPEPASTREICTVRAINGGSVHLLRRPQQ